MDLPDKSAPPAAAVPKKNIKPVAQGVQVQRPATKRLLHFLFAESPKAMLSKVGREVLVPRAKAGMEEAANSFLHGMLWGQSAPPLTGMVKGAVLRGGGNAYHQASAAPSALQQAQAATTSRSSTGNYQDVVFATQERAEQVLANMFVLLNDFHVVAVGDLYELSNITAQISDGAYGWTSLDGARIVHERDGYVLALPRPTLIT